MTDDRSVAGSPHDDDPVDLAPLYALDALDDVERRRLERALESAPAPVVAEFDRQVDQAREVMARIAEASAIEPPDRLRAEVLGALDRDGGGGAGGPGIRRWLLPGLAAAAAVVIALAGVAVGSLLNPSPETVSEQVFAASDVRTVSAAIGGDGTATVVFSRTTDAGVLVMNNVPPPAAGTVYQMWLLGPAGPVSAGTMAPDDVAPSTTAVLEDIGTSTGLGFSVEPPGGSVAPGEIFAELPLV
ncbi:anti-sigma factor [Millisia brevis]|uniref:anti-sigma factor n=1 Tax=Millisia brevis TaxID=264148 RepID=UPI0008361B77|nr:anti-sigma factor [Millisia brevis]